MLVPGFEPGSKAREGLHDGPLHYTSDVRPSCHLPVVPVYSDWYVRSERCLKVNIRSYSKLKVKKRQQALISANSVFVEAAT